MNILISACLLGVNCKYNGGNNKLEAMMEKMNEVIFVPICPEQLGGLTTPRPPAEFKDADTVMSKEGVNVTAQFALGAEETLKIAKLYQCKYAILKERSPSCGGKQIYDGTFQGRVIEGMGMAARLLEQNGVRVFSEENYEELFKMLQK